MSSPWSRRWRELLDDTTPQGALRVARGRAYCRSGRVTGLRVGPGVVSARVQGRRATPYRAEVHIPVLPPDVWQKVLVEVAGQARHGARLLAGQVPEGLDDDLARVGVALFPQAQDLATTCGCDDPLQPCAHVAAAMEATAAEMDEDPFVLLRLRGRGRERLLAELAEARRSRPAADPGVAVNDVDADWERASGPLEVALRALQQPPPLERLGNPPGWRGGVDAVGLFGPLVHSAAAWARDVESAHERR